MRRKILCAFDSSASCLQYLVALILHIFTSSGFCLIFCWSVDASWWPSRWWTVSFWTEVQQQTCFQENTCPGTIDFVTGTWWPIFQCCMLPEPPVLDSFLRDVLFVGIPNDGIKTLDRPGESILIESWFYFSCLYLILITHSILMVLPPGSQNSSPPPPLHLV